MKNSFSLQWTRWAYTMYDSHNKGTKVEGEAEKLWNLAMGKGMINGQDIADLGCGSGRMIEIAVKRGAKRVVGFDISRESLKAAEAHFDLNYHSLHNINVLEPIVNFVETDVLNIGCAGNMFDGAYSIGVLHHTPDPFKGIQEAYRILKPGGWFALVLYPKDSYYDSLSVRLFRKIFRLIPLPAYILPLLYSYYMGYVINPMCSVIPKLSSIVRKFLPFCPHKDNRWSTLGTFDSLTPKYNSTHTTYEVYNWLKGIGFMNIQPTEVGSTSFIANKPFKIHSY